MTRPRTTRLALLCNLTMLAGIACFGGYVPMVPLW